MLIEVLGTGCPKCNKLEEMARQAADKLGVSYRIEHVHDIMAMVERGVMAPPALVIDGSVVVSGRLPSESELETWIQAADT